METNNEMLELSRKIYTTLEEVFHEKSLSESELLIPKIMFATAAAISGVFSPQSKELECLAITHLIEYLIKLRREE